MNYVSLSVCLCACMPSYVLLKKILKQIDAHRYSFSMKAKHGKTAYHANKYTTTAWVATAA